MQNRRVSGLMRVFLAAVLPLAVLGLSVLWLGWQPLPVAAATIVVDRATGIDTPTCGPVDPCWSISYAVANRAISGDVVWVWPGTYTETVEMAAGVVISGSGSSVTFIDGEDVRGPMVMAGSGITESAALLGFTVQRGNSGSNGGGLSIGSGASPIIANCVVSGSVAAANGGGIYIDASSPALVDVKVLSNTAQQDGGGLYVSGSAALSGTHVVSNTAMGSGGGLYITDNAVITNAQVLGNVAVGWGGGGLYQGRSTSSSHITVSGGRFENNRATGTGFAGYGGGLFGYGTATIAGTRFAGNYAYRGGGMFLPSGTISGVEVISNTADLLGGGLRQTDLSAPDEDRWIAVTDSSFMGNETLTAGGGAMAAAGNLALTRTQMVSNSAAGRGGGVYVVYDIVLDDCTIVSNTAVTGGGGLSQYDATGQVTVTGGLLAGNAVTGGAGGGLEVSGSSLNLTGTQILENTASGNGGGVAVAHNAVLSGIELRANKAGQAGEADGGGLFAAFGGGVVSLVGGSVSGNVTTRRGGGLAIGDGVVTGTQFGGNSAALRGGAVYADAGLLATNVLLAANAAPNGAAIYLRGLSGSQTLRHTTVASATVGGGSAIYVYSGTVGITNTIVASYSVGLRQEGGTISEDYDLYFGNGTDIQSSGGQLHSGTHRLFGQDPHFVDPATGDYHIDDGSAALDAGAFLLEVSTDIDGDARPTNTAQPNAPDIGCDENLSTSVRRTITDTMTFGAVCARLVFTDSAELTAVTVGVAYEYPSDLTEAEPLRRVYTITPEGSGAYEATLTLCYDDAEASEAGVNEAALRAYRYDGSAWVPYTSTVDVAGDVVTATRVVTFSTWALAGDRPTAVELVSFSAVPVENGVSLEWETATEIRSLGFNIYRAGSNGSGPVRLNGALIPGAASGSTAGARYRWVDGTAEPGASFSYWLEDVDVRGLTRSYPPASAGSSDGPRIYLPPVLR